MVVSSVDAAASPLPSDARPHIPHTAATVVAYDDLGAEALYALNVERFPVVTIIDSVGANFHESARQKWGRESFSKERPGK